MNLCVTLVIYQEFTGYVCDRKYKNGNYSSSNFNKTNARAVVLPDLELRIR
jgi:hypothetical protein